MNAATSPHLSNGTDETAEHTAAESALGRKVRVRSRAVLLLLVAAGVIVGALANEWISDRLPGGWRFELLLGALLLTGAAAFASVLLARTWHELHAAKQLLTVATGNLAEAYDALLETNRALGETAAARDHALNYLQTAIREREAFLASVSHDLKSPLTIIKGHADMLNRHVKGTGAPNPDRLSDGLDRIVNSAATISTMVDELLWLARLEMDQHVGLDRRPTDLVELARRAAADFGGTTTRHHLRVTPNVPQLVGWWDEGRLERIVANLLSNAIKYSPDGGDIDIAVDAEDDGTQAILSVSDHGVGIPEDDLPHVFERFYRADNVGSLITGTGVGLSGVRHAVEAHGGTITVVHRDGGGSTFIVRLPVGISPPTADAGDHASA